MQLGEIKILTLRYIDFKNKAITINKSWIYNNKNIKYYDSNRINKSTKNTSSTKNN